MEETKYQEIRALQDIFQKYKIEIRVSNNEFLAGNKNYPAVVFSLEDKSFNLFVDDDYSDLKYNNHLLTLYLVLRELDYYSDSSDYILWCKEHLLEPENKQVISYYRSLGSNYRDIEKILGKIDSQISDYDFELNAGAAQELRSQTKFTE